MKLTQAILEQVESANDAGMPIHPWVISALIAEVRRAFDTPTPYVNRIAEHMERERKNGTAKAILEPDQCTYCGASGVTERPVPGFPQVIARFCDGCTEHCQNEFADVYGRGDKVKT